MNLIEAREDGNIVMISFKQERIYDESSISIIGEELCSLIESNHKAKEFIIDFSNTNYLSSSMLGKLISANKKAKANNAVLSFKSMSENVKEIFQVTKIARFFKFVD